MPIWAWFRSAKTVERNTCEIIPVEIVFGDITSIVIGVVVGYVSHRNRLLLEPTKEIKTLRGIIPMCAVCKKIRDENEFWGEVEKYLIENTNAKISHGLCPDCMKKHYPEYSDTNKRNEGEDKP